MPRSSLRDSDPIKLSGECWNAIVRGWRLCGKSGAALYARFSVTTCHHHLALQAASCQKWGMQTMRYKVLARF